MDKSIDRQPFVDNINNILSNFSQNLNSNSYEISNNDQLIKFIMDHSDVRLNYGKGFKYSEIGVWGSNYDAWIKFLQTDKDYLLIFEDDVSIVEDFENKIKNAMQELPYNWDAFFFLTPDGNKEHYYKAYEHDIGFKNICKSYQGNWLGGYMLTKMGAQLLVNDVTTNMVTEPVDIYMFYVQKFLNMFAFKPSVQNICSGVNLPTTIHNSNRIGE
jgi:GR25 family glycosyltransferase involved in LPS biosynthesis